jgi:hypothetical protein
MDVHKNARLTFSCRVLLVQRIQAGRPERSPSRTRTRSSRIGKRSSYQILSRSKGVAIPR